MEARMKIETRTKIEIRMKMDWTPIRVMLELNLNICISFEQVAREIYFFFC
jgi:hypothetical protein